MSFLKFSPPPPISRRIILIALFSLFPLATAGAQWYKGIFIEGSAQYYYTPGFFSELVKPEIGGRGALGCELQRFRLAVESGFTSIEGTNPLVLNIDLVPLVFKFGYALPVIWGFGVQADVDIGCVFSTVTRYATAMDVALENLRKENERHPLAGARLYLTWTTPGKFFKIYAGGGGDIIFETEGPLPLPLIEAGVSIKPAALVKKKEIEAPSVHFQPNSVSVSEESLFALDEAGERLRDNPKLRVTLTAYAAPSGVEMQVRRKSGVPALSAARAAWCAEYLQENYEIDASRIKTEYKQAKSAEPEKFRSVELIVK